jgi:carnosine N-methyltransferase
MIVNKNYNFGPCLSAYNFFIIFSDSWDCIATVFFIDTAHNIVAYIEKIYEILRPGGYWINLGPLLYHFADMPNESSIELSYEDVKSVIEKTGFVIEVSRFVRWESYMSATVIQAEYYSPDMTDGMLVPG